MPLSEEEKDQIRKQLTDAIREQPIEGHPTERMEEAILKVEIFIGKPPLDRKWTFQKILKIAGRWCLIAFLAGQVAALVLCSNDEWNETQRESIVVPKTQQVENDGYEQFSSFVKRGIDYPSKHISPDEEGKLVQLNNPQAFYSRATGSMFMAQRPIYIPMRATPSSTGSSDFNQYSS